MAIRSARQSLTRTNTVDRSKIRSAGDAAVFDGDYDPYYSSVSCHLSDSDYTVSVMTDWSANKWNEMFTFRSYGLMDGRIASTAGPRSQHWANEYTYNGYERYADTPQLRFGNNNFTIEFWIKTRKQNGSEIYVMGKGAGAGRNTNRGWVIGLNSSYQPFFFDGKTGVTITASTALARDTWYHVAFVRSSTSTNGLKIYVGGSLSATGTSSGNFDDTDWLKIGRDRNSTSGTSAFWGLIADLRVQTGSSYTPATPTLPTAALSMTGTNVVLSQSMAVPHYSDRLGRIRDYTGDMTRRIDSPFYTYSEQTGHGVGAIATRDRDSWIKVNDTVSGNTSLRFGTGNFTVEAWICPQANIGIQNTICGKGSGGWTFWVNYDGYLVWRDGGTDYASTDLRHRISSGAWQHVAAVRTSTGADGFKMYVNGLMIYSGTLSTNYSDTDPLYLLTDSNASFESCSGMVAGLAISKIARYNPTAVSTGVTATDDTGIITCGSTTGFIPGDIVTFTGSQGDINTGQYWIYSVLNSTQFTVSDSQDGGQFVTSTSSGSGSLTASLTPEFSVSGTAFIDTQMTVDANHSLLIGTCGTNPIVNSQPGIIDRGDARVTLWREGNEIRIGGGAPSYRHGSSLWFRDAGQHPMKAFVNSSNPNDFTFGTNDFSIEFWAANFRATWEENTNDIILDTRAAWNDSGIRIRKCPGLAFDVLTRGKIVLTSNNSRCNEYARTVNGTALWGTRYLPNGMFAPKVWTHVCIQRTSNNLALYINGVKNTETYYTGAINTPLGKIIIGNSEYGSSSDYNSGYYGWLSDIRICNGSSAYGSSTKNPPTIPVPTAPLTTISNCVLLVANTSSYLKDQSGRANRFGYEQTLGNASSTWAVRHVPYSPYQGVDFDHTTQIWGHVMDDANFYGSSSNPRYNQDGSYTEFDWINRMTSAWTIEGFIYPYQSGDSNRNSPSDREMLWTARSGGHDGFRVRWNIDSNGSTAWGNLTLEFFNNNSPQIQYLGTTNGLTANNGEGYMKPYTWNHFAFQYNPSATNKMACFINGNRISTGAAFTANTSNNPGTSYALNLRTGVAGVRISKTARYNNDATTYTVPTSYTVDSYTWCQPSTQYPIINDKKMQTSIYGPYGTTLSTHYKKFGNGSMKFGNKEALAANSQDYCARFYIENSPGITNNNAFTTRDGDFTIECWAAWQSAVNGGSNFNTDGYGNFLWTMGETIGLGVNGSGYWKFQHAPYSPDSSHWIYNVGPGVTLDGGGGGGHQLFQTNILVAQPTLASPNTFDHVVIQRKSFTYYFYINGVEMAIMAGNYNQTSYSVNNFDPWDIYDSAGSFQLGADQQCNAYRSWNGWMQDFRTSTIARYDTVSIGGVPTMCYTGTEVPALPTKPFQTK